MKDHMQGVYLTGHGGPEKLEFRTDIPVPSPGPGQVLVRVKAAGINNTDINTRVGWYSSEVTGGTDAVDQEVEAGGWGGALHFPRIQGADLCGVVETLGAGVSSFKVGSRVTCPVNLPRVRPGAPMGFIVIGSEIDGAFAQYCVVDADDLYDVTASPLTDVEVAAIPCAFGTAEGLLTRAGVTAGQEVLITGASGGVGLAAVELAALRGARVTALTSAAKAKAVHGQGAAVTLDRNASLPKDQFDVVIDVVGGSGWGDLILALKSGGHYAMAGAIAGPMVQADLRDIYLRDITIHGCTYQSPEIFGRLVALMNAGRIKPLVSKTYPLQDIAKAQEEFQSKSLPGKLVLIPE
ncbi:Crotonyl-CoA reductase [Phaeobacter sp. CECT 5382]|uniref:alcohol dehydrogenase family protein n=1 Tax=Phaeobacter sp. CECT 5382 TaxID=1712645 RepID=UPI0006DB5B8A|nr:alcohol dehydrogenase family protein [Phaeobacter sp. CECT 5382]CUH86750.1 Crotonyl-CoA reductase [Phaeobacter sp. CECT 5382]